MKNVCVLAALCAAALFVVTSCDKGSIGLDDNPDDGTQQQPGGDDKKPGDDATGDEQNPGGDTGEGDEPGGEGGDNPGEGDEPGGEGGEGGDEPGEEGPGAGGGDEPEPVVKYRFDADISALDEGERLGEVTAYLFGTDGLLTGSGLCSDGVSAIEVEAVEGTFAYFLAGASLTVEEGVTRRTDFLKMSYGSAAEHRDSAPELMTAQTILGDGAGRLTFMRRTARLDIDTSADDKIAVAEVTLSGAAAATLPFMAGGDAGGETLTYRKSFASPAAGRLANVFRLYEKSSAVAVHIRGTYAGIPVFIDVDIPSIEAGKVYTVALVNTGSTIEGRFDVAPWQEGDTVVGYPDTEDYIRLDRTYTSVPAGVTVDFAANTVEVPAEGAEMTLAFSASSRVEVSPAVSGGGNVTVGAPEYVQTGSAVVSKYRVTVAPQGRGRLGYSVTLNLKYSLLSGSYDYLVLRIAPSVNQIETVVMAGVEWMAFNAVSPELDDQIYPLAGAAVEDMYRNDWLSCVGCLFQFGRMYPYIPWQSYNPSNNLGNQTADIPWQNASHMPCPEGYRVPTPAELNALLPDGMSMEGSFTNGAGERIFATVNTAAGTVSTPTGVGGQPRYLKLTADDGRVLIIPLAGNKGDKSTSANPGFGQRAVLWTNNRGDNLAGGWAYTQKVEYNGGAPAASSSSLQMEGFASLRCVKK